MTIEETMVLYKRLKKAFEDSVPRMIHENGSIDAGYATVEANLATCLMYLRSILSDAYQRSPDSIFEK